MARSPKTLSKYITPLKAQGMDFLSAAAKAGVSVQFKQIEQAGAAPFSVVLADHGLSDMADALYTVFVQGETALRATVDQSTITEEGFDILGGADTEVLHIVIVGCLEGQSQ